MDEFKPGLIALLGSGETLPSSGKTHEYLAKNLPEKPEIAILETPAGFELNADRVAGKIKEFLEVRLQNYAPQITQIPARKKGTELSPDDEELVSPALTADEILLGPGSPTYAVRQLGDSLLYEILKARHRMGAAVLLSSAATLAFSQHTIPVYEIYKVGEDLHWKDGLGFFDLFGFSLTVVPHWNNQDGGEELDTSRCYIGQSRFNALYEMLPADAVILGIDDHTSVVLDFEADCCHVLGNGAVHVLKNGVQEDYPSGEKFPLSVLGELKLPAGSEGIRPEVWQMALEAQRAAREAEAAGAEPTAEVLEILDKRKSAREAKEWDKADELREEIEALGWQVNDTPEGTELLPLEV
jgi:hypothetical protein